MLEKKSPEEVKEILARLRAGLEDLYEDRLRGLYLFGSYAKGQAVDGSDIDVLIVLDRVDSSWEEIKRTSRLRQELSLEYEVSLNTLWTSERKWREGGAPVLEAIRREGQPA